ncbi:hypothetical protein CR513_16521, partial [Mucuna pruriens]
MSNSCNTLVCRHLQLPCPILISYRSIQSRQRMIGERCQILCVGRPITRRCIPKSEAKSILHFCHSASGGGHYRSIRIARKVLDCGCSHFRLDLQPVSESWSGHKQKKRDAPVTYVVCEIYDIWRNDKLVFSRLNAYQIN